MMKIQNIEVFNIRGAFRGMRFPMQSNDRADSGWERTKTYYSDGVDVESKFFIGPKDLKLAQHLIKAGSDHSKFLRQIMVSMDITSSLYWWKEMDTYKVGTTANSESTMHRLAHTPITKECFSFDNNPDSAINETFWRQGQDDIVDQCEALRMRFLETKNKQYWRALIQLLPQSWNQKRHWTGNYAVLRNIYHARLNHKLKEWQTFCHLLITLPYGIELITWSEN